LSENIVQSYADTHPKAPINMKYIFVNQLDMSKYNTYFCPFEFEYKSTNY